jgi:hypothetical protein
MEFSNKFLFPSYIILLGQNPSRMPMWFRKILQLSLETMTSDWYLYQDFIVIQIYGCEIEPYLLALYISQRLFALEYSNEDLQQTICVEYHEIRSHILYCLSKYSLSL